MLHGCALWDARLRKCLAPPGENLGFLERSDFDEVRNYVRYGVPAGQNDPGLVFPRGTEAQLGFASPAPIGGGHLILTSWDAAYRAIFSHVTIFGALGYQIVLCKDYRGVWFDILKGHYFDVGNREIREARITRQLVMSSVV